MKMKNKLVSIIILSYCNIKGIYETLESVLEQNYSPIELIISDDGTPGFGKETDKLRSYIDEHKQDNIVNVIINAIPVNAGTVKNVNSALALAKGYYIKLISAEDYFVDANSIRLFVEYLEGSDFDICFSKVRGVTPEGEFVYELASCDSDYDKLKKYSIGQIRNYLFARNFLPAPAAFMKRGLFERYGFFKEDTKLIEDYPFWLYLSGEGVPFGFLDRILVNYRLSGVSSKGVYGVKFMEDMYVIYERFIFPYDRRYAFFQGVYNFLKRQGLDSYMAKAKWEHYSKKEKFISYLKYGIFFLYINMQNAAVDRKNRKRQ